MPLPTFVPLAKVVLLENSRCFQLANSIITLDFLHHLLLCCMGFVYVNLASEEATHSLSSPISLTMGIKSVLPLLCHTPLIVY